MPRYSRPTVSWPSWRYGPNGSQGIFNSEDEVPEGWTKKPWDPDIDIVDRPEPEKLDREAIIAVLTEQNKSFHPASSTSYLKSLL